MQGCDSVPHSHIADVRAFGDDDRSEVAAGVERGSDMEMVLGTGCRGVDADEDLFSSKG
jgi:hypothetical protein